MTNIESFTKSPPGDLRYPLKGIDNTLELLDSYSPLPKNAWEELSRLAVHEQYYGDPDEALQTVNSALASKSIIASSVVLTVLGQERKLGVFDSRRRLEFLMSLGELSLQAQKDDENLSFKFSGHADNLRKGDTSYLNYESSKGLYYSPNTPKDQQVVRLTRRVATLPGGVLAIYSRTFNAPKGEGMPFAECFWVDRKGTGAGKHTFNQMIHSLGDDVSGVPLPLLTSRLELMKKQNGAHDPYLWTITPEVEESLSK